jgi:hypothetical protein
MISVVAAQSTLHPDGSAQWTRQSWACEQSTEHDPVQVTLQVPA